MTDTFESDVSLTEIESSDGARSVVCSQAKANAHKRIEDAEQRQRHLATQLSEKQARRNSLIESKLRGELKQEEFRDMADMIAQSKVVGASGFEPPTSWSRTMHTNSINALSGVA